MEMTGIEEASHHWAMNRRGLSGLRRGVNCPGALRPSVDANVALVLAILSRQITGFACLSRRGSREAGFTPPRKVRSPTNLCAGKGVSGSSVGLRASPAKEEWNRQSQLRRSHAQQARKQRSLIPLIPNPSPYLL